MTDYAKFRKRLTWVLNGMLIVGIIMAMVVRNNHPLELGVCAALLFLGCFGKWVLTWPELQDTKPLTEQQLHQNRLSRALEALREADRVTAGVMYPHPNIDRANLHIQKAIAALERRAKRLRREAKVTAANRYPVQPKPLPELEKQTNG